MKIKKLLTTIITWSAVTLVPTQAFAWVRVYEYNKTNIFIANLLKTLAIIAIIANVIIGIIYIIKAKQEKEVITKNITRGIIITGIVVMALLYIGNLVYKAGIIYN